MHNGTPATLSERVAEKRNVVSPLRVTNVCVVDDTMQEKRNVVLGSKQRDNE